MLVQCESCVYRSRLSCQIWHFHLLSWQIMAICDSIYLSCGCLREQPDDARSCCLGMVASVTWLLFKSWSLCSTWYLELWTLHLSSSKHCWFLGSFPCPFTTLHLLKPNFSVRSSGKPAHSLSPQYSADHSNCSPDQRCHLGKPSSAGSKPVSPSFVTVLSYRSTCHSALHH